MQNTTRNLPPSPPKSSREMPIIKPDGLQLLNNEAFNAAAYEVIETVFAVHHDLGRLFDEDIYTKEICRRLAGSRAQVKLEIWYDSFHKAYYIDLLYANGAVFELKATENFVERHRAQLLNYLLVLELPHGKLINLRNESVEHEFVNAPLTRVDRTNFSIEAIGFLRTSPLSNRFVELLEAMLRDWGTCLEINLYEEAITHFFGGEAQVLRPVDVISSGIKLGTQTFRLLAPDSAFKITAFEGERPRYEASLRRMIAYTSLEHLHWVNIGRRKITFKTISK